MVDSYLHLLPVVQVQVGAVFSWKYKVVNIASAGVETTSHAAPRHIFAQMPARCSWWGLLLPSKTAPAYQGNCANLQE
jgi:hypothetical protein